MYIKPSKFKQFKILEMNNNKKYLIDLEHNILNYIFPSLVWFFSQTIYEIPDDINFESSNKKHEIKGTIFLIVGVCSILSKKVVAIANKFNIIMSFYSILFIILLIFILILGYKRLKYLKLKNYLKNKYNLKNPQKMKIIFFMNIENMKYSLSCCVGILLFYIFISLNIYTVIYIPNIIFFVMLGALLHILLMTNTTIPPFPNIKDIKFY